MAQLLVETDEYGIPTIDAVWKLERAEATESDARLEKTLKRKLTPTELSAAESMASEHASYGSTRFHLQTLLPVRGANHPTSVGDEAASSVIHIDPVRGPIVLAVSSESHNSPSYVCAHPGRQPEREETNVTMRP